jgi:hypothetical protein
MAYLGNTPTTQSFISGTDYFSGNGSTTAFTLTRTVASVNDIEAVVNNVVQRPNDAYTISGTTITFTSAPSSGTDNIYVRYLSTTTQSITPSQNTVAYSTLNTDLQSGGYASNFKNRIINGAMMIDQRNAGASVSVTSTAAFYSVDRYRLSGQNSDGVFSAQQVTDAPAGFVNSLKITVTTADSSLTSAQTYSVRQRIEGYNIADLAWGTASASPVTLSFWVKSSVTGTFGGSLNSSASARSYPYTYTISAANTWEYKTVTIAGSTSGTWSTDNTAGITLWFGLGIGTDASGTAGTWADVSYISATGATNLMATGSATWQVTGVQLEKGSTATSFDYRPYGTELALCQRYYQIIATGNVKMIGVGFYGTSTYVGATLPLVVTMRTSPTVASSTGTDYYSIYRQGTDDRLNSLILNIASPYVLSIYNSTEASGTSGVAGELYTNNAAAYLAAQAEL